MGMGMGGWRGRGTYHVWTVNININIKPTSDVFYGGGGLETNINVPVFMLVSLTEGFVLENAKKQTKLGQHMNLIAYLYGIKTKSLTFNFEYTSVFT